MQFQKIFLTSSIKPISSIKSAPHQSRHNAPSKIAALSSYNDQAHVPAYQLRYVSFALELKSAFHWEAAALHWNLQTLKTANSGEFVLHLKGKFPLVGSKTSACAVFCSQSAKLADRNRNAAVFPLLLSLTLHGYRVHLKYQTESQQPEFLSAVYSQAHQVIKISSL